MGGDRRIVSRFSPFSGARASDDPPVAPADGDASVPAAHPPMSPHDDHGVPSASRWEEPELTAAQRAWQAATQPAAASVPVVPTTNGAAVPPPPPEAWPVESPAPSWAEPRQPVSEPHITEPTIAVPSPVAPPPIAAGTERVVADPVSSAPQPVRQRPPQPAIEASAAVDNGTAVEWLAAYGLEKRFGRRQVVKGVSLGLRRGEAVALLGPNGAGKTTVFYMITGLIHADEGAIELDGYDITRLPMYRRARLGIGYLPQEPSIFRGMTVEQNINAVLEVVEPNRKKRREQLDQLLEEFNITRLRKSPAIALSGGERRRCEIARALASRPTFMLLDEPFAGIDPIAVGDIRSLVRHLTDRGIGVLITDHNVRETLGLIDRAYIIHDGQVLMEGTADEVVANESVRRHYLGEEFSL